MDGLIALIGNCFPCSASPAITIKGNKYKIIRLLGEGGFSYVYLVTQSNDSYALKKINCPFGNDETYKNAIKEVRNYHRFASPYIIQSIEEVIISSIDGSRIVYVLLPYFKESLQDVLNALVIENKSLPEAQILKIFVGICRGLKVMHKYKFTASLDDNEEEEDMLLPQEGDLPLEESCPYAHRDIKPANVMISPEGLPVLVDLGSTSKARISITNRQQALSLTDFASENCTLPYRPPELLDVITGSEITEKTDIWSIGCLLYACCFHFSPFEKLEIDQGANLNVAICQGKYLVPENDYSEELIQIIADCLNLDPEKRPDIDELIDRGLELTRRNLG